MSVKTAFEQLKKAMQDLDSSIPDYIFEDDDETSLANKINEVWDKIEVAKNESIINKTEVKQ